MFSVEKLSDGSVRIYGVLAIPRVSRNKIFYPPEELERAVKKLGGREIPIYLEHIDAQNAVGRAKLIWNPEKMQVEFEGIITDPNIAKKVADGVIKHVSLGADYEVLEPMDGYQRVRGLEFRELSLVAVPGIPEANILAVEGVAESLEPEILLAHSITESADKLNTTAVILMMEEAGELLEKRIAEKAIPYSIHGKCKLAPVERPWDRDRADRSLRKWASRDGSGEKETIDWKKYRMGFTWYDPEHEDDFGGYKLPHHEVIDGDFCVVWRGVVAAMAALMGARGGVDIPDEDRRPVYNHLAKHYQDFDKEPPSFESFEAFCRRDYAFLARLDEAELKRLLEFLAIPEVREEFKEDNAYQELLSGVSTLDEIYQRKVERRIEIERIVDAKLQTTLEQYFERFPRQIIGMFAVKDGENAGASDDKNAEKVSENMMPEEALKMVEKAEEKVVEEAVSPAEDPVERYKAIAKKLREAITSTSLPDIKSWNPPIIDLPAGVEAGLRKYVRVAEIPKGSTKAVVSTITTPAFVSLTEGVAPSDVAQTVTHIEVDSAEYGAAQFVTDSVLETLSHEMVQALERCFQRAAVRNEDKVILNALNAETGVQAVYPNGKTDVDLLTVEDTLTWQTILEAKQKILARGYDVSPGRLVLVLHPKQWVDLMKQLGTELIGAADRLFIERGDVLRLFGIDIVVSDQVPTGTNAAGVTLYNAFMFVREESVALVMPRNLRIELQRDARRRGYDIIASERIGAKVIIPDSVVKIVTA